MLFRPAVVVRSCKRSSLIFVNFCILANHALLFYEQDEVEKMYKKALEIDPTNGRYYSNLARIFM